ncbi:MAG: ATP-binding protein, partial [Bacteroidota bacterium]
GRVLLLKKEYQKARDVFLKTIQLKKESDQMVSGNIIWNLGQVYESLGMIDSAYAQYQTSLAFALKTNVAILQAQSYVGLGNVYERQGRWPQAKEAFQNAFQAAMANKLLEQEMDASAGLYRVYKKQGQSGQALRFLEKSRTLRDSLFNEQNVKAMARMEANFEFEKEKQLLAYERERDNEQQQNIRNRLWLIVGGLVFLLLLGLLYFRSKQKAAQELRALNEKLAAQKEKLEEMDQVKSRFFTNISHEFRTPLTVISGMADQIRNKPDAWAQKGAQMIKQNALSLLSLINQILELRKLESRSMKLKLVHGEIIQYMRYIVESFQSYADDKGVTLHILPSVSSLSMDYDADKMLRILTNLCSNAIKYTPEKGHVYISFDQVGEEQMDHLQIRVQDTGVGIPEDQLPHIFDRFYQVEYSQSPKADAHPSHGGGGTGIGLALTQELVELMQGTIHVQSELGKGSTFVVRLPIRQEAAVEAATNGSPQVEDALLPASAIVEESTSSTANTSSAELPSLLVVEDNSDVVQYLLACLEDDYQLSVARDGQQGIDMAIEQVPDLIISDVMMPKKTGYELCALLKQDERTSHIPIVLLTAKADLESKISGLERGADAYLTKPFEQKELMVRLKKLWELRQKLQERFGAFDASLEAAKDSEKVDSPEEIFLRKLENVILTHMEDADFGGVQLCKAMALSRTQLYNKIKALTGRSTSIYLRSVRLRQAKHLLQDTDKNVTEVAYEVGFKDPSYFSRTFAEEFGVPPSKVREG